MDEQENVVVVLQKLINRIQSDEIHVHVVKTDEEVIPINDGHVFVGYRTLYYTFTMIYAEK